MIPKYFIIVAVTLTALISSTVNGQEKEGEQSLVLNSIDFSKNVSFTKTIPQAVTFPKTFITLPAFSMEQKSLDVPTISLDFKNIKPLYISNDFKPDLNYSDYLYCNPNMSSKSIMENMVVEYLVNRYVGSFKLIKSKCNSKK